MTSSMPEVVHSEHAPKALGPYSQGIRVGGFVYTAGQGGIDPQTGQIVEGGGGAANRQGWGNLTAVVEASGSSLAAVVKVNVYMVDLNEFSKMNAVYAEFFPTTKPARTTV